MVEKLFVMPYTICCISWYRINKKNSYMRGATRLYSGPVIVLAVY